ncbi:LexA family protein [Aeromonas media]|uniref:LexA family protein n=1 Tax=Aeromonas media TaxID=651 RepID=UPI003D02A866
MDISDVIKSRRKALKMTQDDLALLVGVSRVSVSQWERGDTSPKGGNFLKLASALGLAPESLMQGSEAGSVTEPKRGYHNVELAVIPRGSRVPILSYVQAGNWREMCEQASSFDGNVEYVAASVEIGPCGFGLWVRGNSMEPRFTEGDLLIADPDVVPKPGDYVIAKNGSEEATFKKYRPRGYNDAGQEVFELTPLNDDYPVMRSDVCPISIIATVIEHRAFFKR